MSWKSRIFYGNRLKTLSRTFVLKRVHWQISRLHMISKFRKQEIGVLWLERSNIFRSNSTHSRPEGHTPRMRCLVQLDSHTVPLAGAIHCLHHSPLPPQPPSGLSIRHSLNLPSSKTQELSSRLLREQARGHVALQLDIGPRSLVSLAGKFFPDVISLTCPCSGEACRELLMGSVGQEATWTPNFSTVVDLRVVFSSFAFDSFFKTRERRGNSDLVRR